MTIIKDEASLIYTNQSVFSFLFFPAPFKELHFAGPLIKAKLNDAKLSNALTQFVHWLMHAKLSQVTTTKAQVVFEKFPYLGLLMPKNTCLKYIFPF